MISIKKLEPVSIMLPEGEGGGGESVWAQPLGNDLYALKNIPFLTPDLAFEDVVFAPRAGLGSVPTYRSVVYRSGHGTLWIVFASHIPRKRRRKILRAVARLGGDCDGEGCDCLAMDLEPATRYLALRTRLRSWMDEGIMQYDLFEPKALAGRNACRTCDRS